jgi:hypothetical protein
VDDPYVRLQPYLRPGERLLWSGRPDPGVWFTPADAFLIPFSILWGGFAIFWEAGVSGGPVFGVVWGIPFVAVGVYMIVGRFFYKRHRKKRTCYGITDRRAIVAVSPGLLSDSPLWNQPVTVRRSGDGRHATVIIGGGPAQRRTGSLFSASASFYANTGMELLARHMALPVAFYDVADPDAMLTAIDQARGPAPIA